MIWRPIRMNETQPKKHKTLATKHFDNDDIIIHFEEQHLFHWDTLNELNFLNDSQQESLHTVGFASWF